MEDVEGSHVNAHFLPVEQLVASPVWLREQALCFSLQIPI